MLNHSGRDSPLTGRQRRGTRRGGKKEGTPAVSLPLWTPTFPLLDSLAKIGERRPLRNRGTAVGLPQRVFLRLFAVHRQRTATHTVKSTQARHIRVAQLVSLEIMDGTYESIYLVAFIFAETVRNNALTNRAALLCRTQRRVARMCSSNLSVNCEYVAKQTLR